MSGSSTRLTSWSFQLIPAETRTPLVRGRKLYHLSIVTRCTVTLISVETSTFDEVSSSYQAISS